MSSLVNGHTDTMQQLLLVHSHLLDQVDRDGVRSIFYYVYYELNFIQSLKNCALNRIRIFFLSFEFYTSRQQKLNAKF
jgi:hypothetical protein